jgi:hypothetical protein
MIYCLCAERPYSATTTTGQPICVVCGDLANGVHFGAITCEGCKVRSVFGIMNSSTYTSDFNFG